MNSIIQELNNMIRFHISGPLLIYEGNQGIDTHSIIELMILLNENSDYDDIDVFFIDHNGDPIIL